MYRKLFQSQYHESEQRLPNFYIWFHIINEKLLSRKGLHNITNVHVSLHIHKFHHHPPDAPSIFYCRLNKEYNFPMYVRIPLKSRYVDIQL